jgi:hypothetical protein
MDTNVKSNLDRALDLCKGSYQRAVVLGQATLGQSDLKGKAKTYKASYNRSVRSLLDKLAQENITYHVVPGKSGCYSSSTLKVD